MDHDPTDPPNPSRRASLKKLAAGGVLASAGLGTLTTAAEAQTACERPSAFLALRSRPILDISAPSGSVPVTFTQVQAAGGTLPFGFTPPGAHVAVPVTGAYRASFTLSFTTAALDPNFDASWGAVVFEGFELTTIDGNPQAPRPVVRFESQIEGERWSISGSGIGKLLAGEYSASLASVLVDVATGTVTLEEAWMSLYLVEAAA